MIDVATIDIQSTAEAAGTWLLATTVRVAALGLAVALLDRVLSGRLWPQVRAALWWLVVVVAVLPPVFEPPISVWNWADPAVRLDAYLTDAGATVETGENALWKALYPEYFANVAPEPTARQSAVRIVSAVWLGGFVFLLTAALWRGRRLRRRWLGESTVAAPNWLNALVRRAAGRIGLKRPPALVIHSGPFGPAVVGSWRPTVVIPARLLAEASRDEIEHVLLHEFAHVLRRDALASRLCLFVHLLFWFHPILWLARIRLETLREICCDEAVVRALRHRGPAYRETLLRMAESLLARPSRIGFVSPYSRIMSRLSHLQRCCPRRPGAIRAASSVVFAVLLACCIPRAKPSAPPEEPVAEINLSELPGCMQLRLAVLRARANQANAERNRERKSD